MFILVFLTVCQVLYVALHPASRRRSYFKFSARMRPDRLESSTPEDHGASQRTSADLRIGGPCGDNGKRFSLFIGSPWAWRIGVHHSLLAPRRVIEKEFPPRYARL